MSGCRDRAFQVHLVAGGISWPALNQIVCALRFLYGVTLRQSDLPEHIPYAREPQKLPVVLGADEVVCFLEAVPSLKSRAALTTAFHTAAISFSDRISRDRVYFRKELEDNRWKAGLYQTLILVIGALATIAIGVKSTLPREAKPSLSIAIGIFALSLSAAGTAVSSMSSFDGSQSIALRDQRALSQLQQLHWRVASDVLSKTGLCKTPATDPGDAMKQVDAWKARLETILDNAVESVAQPGDLSRQTPTLPDTPKPAQPPEAQTAMSSGPSVSASAATSGSGASGRGL